MHQHPTFRWTDENVAALRKLHANGVSMTQIAIELGAGGKNSIVSKCHRLGLAARRPENCAPPKTQRPRAPVVKPAKQHLHAGNIARKAESRARQKDDASLAADRAMIAAFDRSATQKRPDVPGVLFLDRQVLQCAMPLPGWDDLPVVEKLVCGLATVGGTSWCKHCLSVVTTPSYRSLAESNSKGTFRFSRHAVLNRVQDEDRP